MSTIFKALLPTTVKVFGGVPSYQTIQRPHFTRRGEANTSVHKPAYLGPSIPLAVIKSHELSSRGC